MPLDRPDASHPLRLGPGDNLCRLYPRGSEQDSCNEAVFIHVHEQDSRNEDVFIHVHEQDSRNEAVLICGHEQDSCNKVVFVCER